MVVGDSGVVFQHVLVHAVEEDNTEHVLVTAHHLHMEEENVLVMVKKQDHVASMNAQVRTFISQKGGFNS